MVIQGLSENNKYSCLKRILLLSNLFIGMLSNLLILSLSFFIIIICLIILRFLPDAAIGVSWLIQEKETRKHLPTDSIRLIEKLIYSGSSFFGSYNKYNWVAEFGVMVSFKLSEDLTVFVEPFYNMQLNNLVKNASEYTSVKPNCWGLSLGITFIIPDLADEEDKLDNK